MIEFYFQEHSFYEEYKSCCIHNCIRQILKYYGVEHPNLLINSNYFFSIKVDWSKMRLIIERDLPDILAGDLNNLIVSKDVNQLKVEQIIEEDNYLLEQNIPIAINVDVFYLPYDKYYKKSNCLHTVIYCGGEGDKYYLVDIGERIKFKGNISKENYFKARLSNNPFCDNIYSGQPILFREYYVSRGVLEFKNYNKYMLVNINGIKEYYKNVGVLSEISDYFAKIFFLKINIEENELKYIYYQFYSINRKRKLFKLQLLDLRGLGFDTSHLINDVENTLEIWNNILNILLKMLYIKENFKNCDRLSKYFMEIYQNEKNIYKKIVKLEDSLIRFII